jgi:hypothetical protein
MPKNRTFPRREIDGQQYYVIASPDIFNYLTELGTSTQVDIRKLYPTYVRLLSAQVHQLSVDIGLPVTTAPTEVGHDWLIPANDFNATRYIWAERKAGKYFKLLMKMVEDEVTSL